METSSDNARALPARRWASRLLHVWLLLAASASAAAGEGDAARWTSNGPGGGTVSQIAIDPSDPSTLYAGTKAGVFKSTDGADSWVAVNRGLRGYWVSQLKIAPSDPKVLYYSGYGGVFRSSDGAASWQPVREQTFESLLVDPRDADTVYGATFDEIFKTEDGGASWARIAVNPHKRAAIRHLALDPSGPPTLYLGTPGGGVARSWDGGSRWTTEAKPGNGVVGSLALTPVAGGRPWTVWAGTREGLFFSLDTGRSWKATGREVICSVIQDITSVPTDPSILYVATQKCGLFKTSTGGREWSTAGNGLPAKSVMTLAVDPQAPDNVYAGLFEHGLFKSEDGGTSWRSANRGLAASDIFSVAVDPQRPEVVLAGGAPAEGIFRSGSSGSEWEKVWAREAGVFPRVYSVAFHPRKPGLAYAAASFVGVLTSADGGVIWKRLGDEPALSGIRTLAVDPNDLSTLYAGTGSGVLVSRDGGASWKLSALDTGQSSVDRLAIDPLDSGTLVASDHLNLYRTTDAGRTWSKLPGPVQESAKYPQLAFDGRKPGTLYVGTQAHGVFRSTDGGQWTPVNRGLPPEARTLAFVAHPGGSAMYVAVWEGLFCSTNGGSSWRRLDTTGLTTVSDVRQLAIDGQGRILYAATSGGGVFSRRLVTPCPGQPPAGGSAGPPLPGTESPQGAWGLAKRLLRSPRP